MGLSEDKIELRKKFKEIRKKVFINDGENFSFLISNFLQNIIKKKDKIALYISFNSEVKTMDLIQTLVLNDYQVCLPVIKNKSEMFFRSYLRGGELIESKFSIFIPKKGDNIIPDTVFCPLLSYDNFGNRLGYGGGFYDRTIYKLRKQPNFKVIGLAFSEQKSYSTLPTNSYDQKLDGLITEKGLRWFNKKNFKR